MVADRLFGCANDGCTSPTTRAYAQRTRWGHRGLPHCGCGLHAVVGWQCLTIRPVSRLVPTPIWRDEILGDLKFPAMLQQQLSITNILSPAPSPIMLWTAPISRAGGYHQYQGRAGHTFHFFQQRTIPCCAQPTPEEALAAAVRACVSQVFVFKTLLDHM